MMVEQNVVIPRFSDFFGLSLEQADQYNPLIPIELGFADVLLSSSQRGFRVLVREIEGFDSRRLITVDPGVDYPRNRFGAICFFVENGRVYINGNERGYIANLYALNKPSSV